MKQSFKNKKEILSECTKSNEYRDMCIFKDEVMVAMEKYAAQFYTREQVESICMDLLGIAAVNLNIGIVPDKQIDTGLYWKYDDGAYQMVEINRNSITDTITHLDEIINKIKP